MTFIHRHMPFLGSLFAVWICNFSIHADDPLRSIRVTGEGKAAAPPDMATIVTGVVTKAPTATAALEENSQSMKRILDVLKEHDIAPRDTQTTSFLVQPVYDRDAHGRMLPVIVAYHVSNQLQVRVRHLPNLGRVLDALVKAGSNQISGIQFGLDDPSSLLTQARERAMADARNRADVYARGAGVRVGKVQVISEQPIAMPMPRYLEAAVGLDRASAVPIAAGEQEIRVTIQVIYAIE